MDEYKLISKISNIKKGSRVAIVVRHNGKDTAVGFNCSSPEGYSVELRGAFEAILQEFDGDIMKLSTASYPCLKISVQDLGDVLDLTYMIQMEGTREEEI